MANIDWQQINEIMGSRGFENAAKLGGTFLATKGAADRDTKQSAQNVALSKAQLGQNANQFATTMAARLAEAKRADALSRAVSAANALKLGENENFATRNRILSAVLPNLRNSAMVSSDPRVAKATPQVNGPLPEGGLPPELLSAIGERATANAIANRSKAVMNIDPNAPTPDFEGMGFSPDDANFDLAGYGNGLRAANEQSYTDENDMIQRALMSDYEGLKSLDRFDEAAQQKKGFWGKLGGILKVAAPIAASFIPGVGPILGAAIAGGGSAAGSLMQGDPISQALLSGGIGAAGAYGAKNLPKTNRPLPGQPGYGVLKP